MAIVINGSGTVTGLAVGGLPDGTVDEGTLATDSVTTTKIPAALENTFVSGRKNLIINGGFDVWQRGTSFTASGYTADRWELGLSGATSTVTQQAFTLGQTEVPDNPTYYLKVDTTTGDNNCGLYYRVEDVRNGAGQNATLSFWAKGTNPAGGVFDLISSQRFGTGGSGNVETVTPLTFTSSWVKYTHTFSVASIAGKTVGAGNNLTLSIRQDADDSGTAAWNLNLANVQLELGSVATDFEHRSYGEELDLCQRYFYQQNSKNISYDLILPAMAIDPDDANTVWQPPTSFRATPTVSVSDADHTCLNYNGGNRVTRVNYSVQTNSNNGTSVYLNLDVNSNVLTVGQMVFLAFDNSISGGWIRFDAEL